MCIRDRGFGLTSEAYLNANTSSQEYSLSSLIYPTAKGFFINTAIVSLNDTGTYIYLAIRRPNKPPTTGTQVYNAIARTGTGAAATVTGVGFAPDLVATQDRGGTVVGLFFDRLRGVKSYLVPRSAGAEASDTDSLLKYSMDGISVGPDASGPGGINTSALSYINWFFKRAPGVFDEVCYTGTGVAKTEAHGLGVAPELMIVKERSAANDWWVYNATDGNTKYTVLNTTATPVTASTAWNNTTPTSLVFSVGTAANVNASAQTYVAYLFATCPGVSKVGSYTGNGSSQTINCGFTTGARFFLVKATSTTGSWWIFDSVRG